MYTFVYTIWMWTYLPVSHLTPHHPEGIVNGVVVDVNFTEA